MYSLHGEIYCGEITAVEYSKPCVLPACSCHVSVTNNVQIGYIVVNAAMCQFAEKAGLNRIPVEVTVTGNDSITGEMISIKKFYTKNRGWNNHDNNKNCSSESENDI